ncbi:MAG TPA: hypothetical protein PLD25_25820 [Chloroflexota bacterium]|nr:hypothetical protein [Chloroflexota bacterium]HUM67810.1 hypothetical protein [Chloroflexota bacterium]
MLRLLRRSFCVGLLLVALVACASPPSPTSLPPETPAVAPTAAPTAVPETATAVPAPPPAVAYNLGEAIIVQERFPEDSRFRNMPVQLNGIIAAPPGDGGPYPVMLIIHGTHPGCPVDDMGVDQWPCAPEDEQPNYGGFAYLISYLAAQGYVALAINANAENTFGFGEPTPGERLGQIVDLHLNALAAAATGGENEFGVELNGRADLSNLVFFGHSRGGEAADWLAHRDGLTAPDAADRYGYGPVRGLLMFAPAPIFTLPDGSDVPQAIILPSCDGDVIAQEGQLFYEGARQNPEQQEWVTSVWLERANHNSFNSILPGDFLRLDDRPDCETLLTGEAQRAFLADYATDFLTIVFSNDTPATTAAAARLGLDAQSPAPDVLLGLPARVSVLAAATDRQTLFIPNSADELTTNLVGGAVLAEGVTTFFCEAGYFTPSVKPGSEPCLRANVTIPGNPAMVVVSWEQPGAALRFALPEGAGDLRDYTTLSLRTAVDPLSPLNETGQPQAFSVQLTDRAGATAVVSTRADEPALAFPSGETQADDLFGEMFTGRAPMTTIRWQLNDFTGVDLSQIAEIALLFDQTDSGSLFMGDVEWVR